MHKSISNFEKKNDKIDILFLGDSQIFMGIDPDAINSKYEIYNFGFVSEPIITTYYKLNYYLEKNKLPNLKKVFIVINSITLTRENRLIINKDYDYYKYYNYFWDEIAKGMDWEQKLDYYLTEHFISYRLYSHIKTEIKNRLVFRWKHIYSISESGFCYVPGLVALSPEKFKTRIPIFIEDIRNESRNLTEISEKGINDYKKLIGIFQNNGVDVTLITLPSASVMISSEEKELYRENQIILADFVEKHFENVSYINFSSEEYRDVWEIEDFRDGLHFSLNGSKKMGEILSGMFAE
jgi:hypothetical protein